MAISSVTQPSGQVTAYNPVFSQMSSNDANIVGIRADIFVDGTYKTTIDGTNVLNDADDFTFDHRKIAQSILQHEIRTNITTFQLTDAPVSGAVFQLKFYEIINTAGVFTTNWVEDGAGSPDFTGNTHSIINFALQHLEDFDDWTVDGVNKKLLTARTGGVSTGSQSVVRGVPFQMGVTSFGVNNRARLRTLDSSFVQLTNVVTATVVLLTNSKGIIEIPSANFSSASAKYLEITLENSSSVQKSQVYTFPIVDDCPDTIVLFWQNHYGGMDHFSFPAQRKVNVNTTDKRVKRPLNLAFNSEDSGEYTLSSQVNETLQVFSNRLSSSELTMLSELIRNHTVVYRWRSAGVFERVNVRSKSRKVEDNGTIINQIQVTISPSNQHTVQMGE